MYAWSSGDLGVCNTGVHAYFGLLRQSAVVILIFCKLFGMALKIIDFATQYPTCFPLTSLAKSRTVAQRSLIEQHFPLSKTLLPFFFFICLIPAASFPALRLALDTQ